MPEEAEDCARTKAALVAIKRENAHEVLNVAEAVHQGLVWLCAIAIWIIGIIRDFPLFH